MVLLIVAAASPSWHATLHGEHAGGHGCTHDVPVDHAPETDDDAGCVVTLFSQGQFEGMAFLEIPVSGRGPGSETLIARDDPWVVRDLRAPPGRGPPVV